MSGEASVPAHRCCVLTVSSWLKVEGGALWSLFYKGSDPIRRAPPHSSSPQSSALIHHTTVNLGMRAVYALAQPFPLSLHEVDFASVDVEFGSFP